MYLACAFISQADPKRYGRLKEELENDYTKGTDSYPHDMVKAYQLLNEYKHWTPIISQADPKRYGRLKEELENDYTKGTDSYPQDMV